MDYRTLAAEGASEVIEKKSRFIGEAVRVNTPEEAEQYIAGVRKHYYDARHHCFAYIAGEPGTPDEILRCSDDGEPSGTAGRPMLEILTGRDLHRCLLVVTRYFGGTLLGTGGLVRAYSAAARDAVEDAGAVCVRDGVELCITCTYTQLGRIQYRFAEDGIRITDTEYAADVKVHVTVPADAVSGIEKLVTELTDGTGSCETVGRSLYEEPV
ncbi:MAG: YigZ family protein [Lachnospiraceae bacterium]|nr:YigZ family protein [Lachnospiraceae bacterium]